MLTKDGPKVVEFNCRFGDPETQAVLPMLASPLLRTRAAQLATGVRLADVQHQLAWKSGAASVTTVVAAAGYPGTSARAAMSIDAPRNATVKT